MALLALAATAAPGAGLPASPDETYGALFADVQQARVFADQKTFPDCEPRMEPASILAAYAAAKAGPGPLDLRAFVAAHFVVPAGPARAAAPDQAPPAGSDLRAHLEGLWPTLARLADVPHPGSSRLPMPYPYVVPGGRFQEAYYWDSYFTMLGLRASGRWDLVGSMVDDFAHELSTYGLIPNGTRTYYLGRSQPPFLALMVELLAQHGGADAYRRYHAALEAEHAYWTDQSLATRHTVHLAGGAVLSRYWDRLDTPRPESFAEDLATADGSGRPAAEVRRDLRSAAESGWDFSSRWLADGRTLGTIRTTRIIPVDLNALLCQLETTLARAREADGQAEAADAMREAATARRAALLRTCWSAADGWFLDYDMAGRCRCAEPTLAGVVPLFLHLATPGQADAAAAVIRSRFERPGGVVTTLAHTGQQWDAPNGWAPLQWMTIQGLRGYGHDGLAGEIARRWVALNEAVWRRTGRMMEKYNVEDLSLAAGGGEYPAQDGFGWTNGVLLALLDQDRPPP